jgi:hypothetical protein
MAVGKRSGLTLPKYVRYVNATTPPAGAVESASPAPLPGRIRMGCGFRWLAPPANFRDASGVECVFPVSSGTLSGVKMGVP